MKGMVLSCLDRILELNFQSEAIILMYCFDFIGVSSFYRFLIIDNIFRNLYFLFIATYFSVGVFTF